MSHLHPSGVFCPRCSTILTDERQAKFNRLEQVRCPVCNRKFTARTGTLMDRAKLEPREIYLLAVLTDLGVTVARIAGVLRCHPDTVLNWQQHFQAQRELAEAESTSASMTHHEQALEQLSA